MNDIFPSVHAPQRGGAGEPKSERVPRRFPGKHAPRVVIVAEVSGLTDEERSVLTRSPGVRSGRVAFDYLILAPGMRDRAGRIRVSPNMEVPERPGIFVVGNAAALIEGRTWARLIWGAIHRLRAAGQWLWRCLTRDTVVSNAGR
jgi:NADH dehydrogenase FAD-containing subunit